MTFHRGTVAREHAEICALIPWYVNGSIGDRERGRVDAHLESCEKCRHELAAERCVHAAMSRDTAVEYMPATSLNRLRARLDGIGSASGEPAPAAKPARRPMPWQGAMAASVAVMAVALSLLAADRWLRVRSPARAPDYYTVTTPAPRASNEVIRAVFAPSVTLAELQAILDEAQLRIVAGPTEAGVYSLAANSHRPVNTSLALLRGHATVRFAESIQPELGPGDTP